MKTWVTKDGTEIPIKKMETSHIKNAMYMLEKRWPDYLPEVYDDLEEELINRGDDDE